MARKWKDYPQRVLEEFDGTKKATSGAAAAVGMMIGGVYGAAVGGIGAGACSLAYCMYKAWPERLRNADELVGQVVKLADLTRIHPALSRVGMIGISETGKSTLLSHVSAQTAPDNIRTEEIYALVSVLRATTPIIYAAVDGAGQQIGQQFKIFDESEIVLICLDHNINSSSLTIDTERLKEQRKFLGQIVDNIRVTQRHPHRVHFVLNKKDQWENNSGKDVLLGWFGSIVQEWKVIPTIQVSHSLHSNFSAADVVHVIGLLSTWLSK